MIQAQAFAARAARVLSRPTLSAGGSVAVVDASRCTGCLTCVRICPFGVPKMRIDLTGVGELRRGVYRGVHLSGLRIVRRRMSRAGDPVMHYTDAQMTAKVDVC